jgi:uncharacterized protein
MSKQAPEHRVNWFEIPTANLEAASRFYAAMLDAELKREEFFGVPHAIFLTAGPDGISGALIADPKRPPRRGAGAVVYLHAVDGVAACVARAVEAGGKVVQVPTEIGPFGTIARIEDPDGNVVGLHTPPAA